MEFPSAEVPGGESNRNASGRSGIQRFARRGGAGLLVLAFLAASCGTEASGPTSTGDSAGKKPSKSAKMICTDKELNEYSEALGVKGSVSRRTWSNDRYSCTLSYPTGTVGLAVKELASRTEAIAYAKGLQRTLAPTFPVSSLGDASFQSASGTMVVRKRSAVLTVDVSGIPPTFGVPPTKSADVAYTYAYIIVSCWTGE